MHRPKHRLKGQGLAGSPWTEPSLQDFLQKCSIMAANSPQCATSKPWVLSCIEIRKWSWGGGWEVGGGKAGIVGAAAPTLAQFSALDPCGEVHSLLHSQLGYMFISLQGQPTASVSLHRAAYTPPLIMQRPLGMPLCCVLAHAVQGCTCHEGLK